MTVPKDIWDLAQQEAELAGLTRNGFIVRAMREQARLMRALREADAREQAEMGL